MIFKVSLLAILGMAATVNAAAHMSAEEAAELAAVGACITSNCGFELGACMAPDARRRRRNSHGSGDASGSGSGSGDADPVPPGSECGNFFAATMHGEAEEPADEAAAVAGGGAAAGPLFTCYAANCVENFGYTDYTDYSYDDGLYPTGWWNDDRTDMELASYHQDNCEFSKKMEPLWAEHEAHITANCVPLCTAQENHEFETCTQFDAACMKQATTAYADRSWSYDDDGEDARDYFEIFTEQLEFLKQCPDAHLDGFGACADTGGTHDGYDDYALSWMYRDDGDDDQTCASFCAEVKAGTAYDDDDDYDYVDTACDAFAAAVVSAAAACKTDGDCTEVDAAFSEAEQDAAAVRHTEALGEAAAKALAAQSDRCVHATKMEDLFEKVDAHYQANCMSMCTAHEKHEFTACTQFEATCLKKATDMYADIDDDDDDGWYPSYDDAGYSRNFDHEAYFDVYAGWFTLLKKCPEADLPGFYQCARDGDHEGYDDDWDDDDDRTCPEFCAAVEAGEAYEDDMWDDDDDSSYSETACADFDAAVATAKVTCKADGTCAAIDAAVKEAAGEQAAADAFDFNNYGSAATSLTVGAATLFASIATMLV
jgi:hypothetical protein